MKLRFLALLTAIALGSAAVLVYAAQVRSSGATSARSDADACGACAMSAAQPAVAASITVTDECCAETAAVQPVVATLAAGGCPYEATTTAAPAALASVQPVEATLGECCAESAAPPAVATVDK